MATTREVRVLSNPTVYLDGRKIKVLPNKTKVELPGEVKTRAVSAGGGAISIVHGYDVEQSWVKVTFEVANTAEQMALVKDYTARRAVINLSTLRLVEDTEQTIVTDAVLANKPEVAYEAEGSITLEFHGLMANV